jgi:hypothetical protein
VHKRSGVARKSVVQPAQPSRGQGVRCALSASLHKDRAFPTTEQHLRPEENRMASGLDHSRRTWSLRSKGSRRPPSTSERDGFGLFASILSGFPNVTTRPFSPCPMSRLISCRDENDRRPRQAPLAREDIPHSLIRQFNTSAWPGCDFQLRSLSLFTQGCGALWRV